MDYVLLHSTSAALFETQRYEDVIALHRLIVPSAPADAIADQLHYLTAASY
ncbi:hypothetical protein SARC_18013, partial [Sphaeroforma arctica JP610]